MATVKPQTPIINWGHPLSNGLVAVFACTEGAGPLLNLVDRQTQLSLANSGVWTIGKVGCQLNCNGNDSGAKNTTPPSSMKIAKQVSILWQGSTAASPTASSLFAGMSYTNTDSGGFLSYSLGPAGTNTKIGLDWNNDGTFDNLDCVPNVAFSAGGERQYLGTIKTGEQRIYENGVLLALSTGHNTASFTNINYVTPQFGIGTYINGVNRDSKSKCSLCYVWNRAVTATEARLLATDSLQIFV